MREAGANSVRFSRCILGWLHNLMIKNKNIAAVLVLGGALDVFEGKVVVAQANVCGDVLGFECFDSYSADLTADDKDSGRAEIFLNEILGDDLGLALDGLLGPVVQ